MEAESGEKTIGRVAPTGELNGEPTDGHRVDDVRMKRDGVGETEKGGGNEEEEARESSYSDDGGGRGEEEATSHARESGGGEDDEEGEKGDEPRGES